jgi:hypothetical protein
MPTNVKEYFYQAALIVIPTAITTTLAVVNKYWNWPTAVVYTVLLIAGLWYLTDKFGITISTRTRVRNWLDESGFGVQTITDSNAVHFVLIDNVGLKTDILQPGKAKQLTVAVGGLKPTEAQLAIFQALDEERKALFWKRVRIELLRFKISYTDLDIAGIAVSEDIPLTSDLTQSELMTQIRLVRGAAKLYYELLNDMLILVSTQTS